MKNLMKPALAFASDRALDLSATLLALAKPVPAAKAGDPIPDTKFSNLAQRALLRTATRAARRDDYATVNLAMLMLDLGDTAREDNALRPFLEIQTQKLAKALRPRGMVTVTIGGVGDQNQ